MCPAEFEPLTRLLLSSTVGRPVCALAHVGGRSAQVYNGANPLELDRITTYFEEIEPRAGMPARYVPRSTQIDLEGGVLNSVSPVAYSPSVEIRLMAACGSDGSFEVEHLVNSSRLIHGSTVNPVQGTTGLEGVRIRLFLCIPSNYLFVH